MCCVFRSEQHGAAAAAADVEQLGVLHDGHFAGDFFGRDIAPDVLEAVQSNDPDWIRAETFNIAALRRKAQRVDESTEYAITKDLVYEALDWTILQIELVVPVPASTRLDRLLAKELAISRTFLKQLHEKERLRTDRDHPGILRHRVKNGTRIAIDLTEHADRAVAWRCLAIGEGCER